MEVFLGLLALAVIGYVLFNMFRSRKRRMEQAAKEGSTAPATGLAVSRDLFDPSSGHHAPVASFHVVGDEARVHVAGAFDPGHCALFYGGHLADARPTMRAASRGPPAGGRSRSPDLGRPDDVPAPEPGRDEAVIGGEQLRGQAQREVEEVVARNVFDLDIIYALQCSCSTAVLS